MKELIADAKQPADFDAPELFRECAKNLRNAELWEEFYSRYRRKILLYLLRAFRTFGGNSEDFIRHADDWLQEVFTKLVQNDGRVIASFRGSNEPSVYAFLGTIAMSVVADQLRYQGALRRRAQFVALEKFDDSGTYSDTETQFSALLELIDVERALCEQTKNPVRDSLIFKLYFVEGLSAREIASIPALKLTTSGLEKVLNRLRSRLAPKEHSRNSVRTAAE